MSRLAAACAGTTRSVLHVLLAPRGGGPGGSILRHHSSSAAVPAVGCYGAVHVAESSHDGMPGLYASRPVAAGEVLFRWTGVLLAHNSGDRCLQVGRQSWLTPPQSEGEPPWVFLNHSFDPSVLISHAPLPATDPAPPVLTATATTALPAEAPLTIDYTLHEYIMCGGGFVCAESGRTVRGFRFLGEAAQEAALPRALDHVKALHEQHLRRSRQQQA
jgi:hypothetical protein